MNHPARPVPLSLVRLTFRSLGMGSGRRGGGERSASGGSVLQAGEPTTAGGGGVACRTEDHHGQRRGGLPRARWKHGLGWGKEWEMRWHGGGSDEAAAAGA